MDKPLEFILVPKCPLFGDSTVVVNVRMGNYNCDFGCGHIACLCINPFLLLGLAGHGETLYQLTMRKSGIAVIASPYPGGGFEGLGRTPPFRAKVKGRSLTSPG